MIEVTANTYGEAVENQTKTVVLDVWAPWCQPCKAIEPVLEELAAAQGDKLVVAKLNVDEQPDLAARLGVMSLPTVRVLKAGQVVFEAVGSVDRARLAAAVAA